MKLPTWDELSRDSGQLDILEYPLDEPLFVAGPPGSGKTVLAVKRAQMLADDDSRVTIVTYNRMLRRLVELLKKGGGANTMHSYVWRDYERRTQSSPPQLMPYEFDWDEMMNTLAQMTKSRVAKDGHLVVDEGQDLPAEFFRYASLHATRVLTVFADEDQALGEQHTTLEEIRAAANLPAPCILKCNHRNSPEIAAVAEHFHSGRLPAADVQRSAFGTLPRLVSTMDAEATASMIATWSKNRGGSIGVIVYSNSLGAVVQKLLKRQLPKRRVDRYVNEQQNEGSIDVTKDGITIVNVDSVKGQEFDTVFVLELARFLPWRDEKMKRVLYMICSRARNYLNLVYGPTPLSGDALSQMPGPNILER